MVKEIRTTASGEVASRTVVTSARSDWHTMGKDSHDISRLDKKTIEG